MGLARVESSERRAAVGRRRVTVVVLGSILVVALWLRTLGLDYGLPAVYNPDEVAIMSRALAFAKGDLNPHNFLYPSLYFYVLFGWVGTYFAAGWLIGIFSSAAAFQQAFFIDPTGVYLAGRVLSVVLGVVAVWGTYALGKRIFGPAAGLAAAAFLAAAPFHVRDSHYVKHDVPASLAIVLALWAIVRVLEPTDPRRRIHALAWASLACGVASSIHYYAMMLAVPLVAAILLQPGATTGSRVRHLLLGAALAAAAFFACSPFLLVEPRTALADIVANRRIVMDRAVGRSSGLFPYVSTYAGMLWNDAIGRGVLLIAAAGVLAGWRASWRITATLLAFGAAFFALLSNTVPATRYLTPLLPAVAAFGGGGAAWVAARFRGRERWVCAALSLVVVASPAVESAKLGRFFSRTDTRTLALRFVESRFPPGTTVAVQPYSVPVTQSRESLEESLAANLGGLRRPSTKSTMRLALRPYPAPAYRVFFLGDGGLDEDKIYLSYGEFDASRRLNALRARKVEYVLLKRPAAGDANLSGLVTALSREAERVALFAPFEDADACGFACPEPFLHNTDSRIDGRLQRPGPVIEIWRLLPSGG